MYLLPRGTYLYGGMLAGHGNQNQQNHQENKKSVFCCLKKNCLNRKSTQALQKYEPHSLPLDISNQDPSLTADAPVLCFVFESNYLNCMSRDYAISNFNVF